MENSFLNLAHVQSRKADNNLRYRRFDEAIECHQKCADYLEEAHKMATVTTTLESLKLQKEYHLKQKELLRVKKLQYERYRKAVEEQKKIALSSEEADARSKERIESCQLQLEIYNTMTETDSLLEILTKRGASQGEPSKSGDAEASEQYTPIEKGGVKKPKDETVVIEELRTLNHQLHILVYQLVQEVEVYRERVKVLEEERSNNMQTKSEQETDESKDCTSNTINKYSLEAHELNSDASESQEIPPLAPLEPFEFGNFREEPDRANFN